jgi:hypothetical protein
MTTWRVGTHVPINVYEDERPICQCHTVEDARRIVRAVNGIAATQPSHEDLEMLVSRMWEALRYKGHGNRAAIQEAVKLLSEFLMR